MNGVEAFDEDSGHTFKPYTIKTLGKARVAIIGQLSLIQQLQILKDLFLIGHLE